MNRIIQKEDIALWPNSDYCCMEDLEHYGMNKSDDYSIIPWDSAQAAIITGTMEDGCKALFNHEFWQILSDAQCKELAAFIGIVD